MKQWKVEVIQNAAELQLALNQLESQGWTIKQVASFPVQTVIVAYREIKKKG